MNIGDDGAISLAKAPKLGYLFAMHNHIGEKGIDALEQANIMYSLYEDNFKLKSNSIPNVQAVAQNFSKFCTGKDFFVCKSFLKTLK